MLAKNENRVNRYNTAFEILQAEATSLKKLINKEIRDIHVAWDLNDNNWYSDEVVVFTIEDVQLGINNCYTNTIDISWNTCAIDDLIHKFDYGYNCSLKYTSELLGYPIESDCSYLKLNPQLVEEMEKIILLFDGSLNWSSPLDDSP